MNSTVGPAKIIQNKSEKLFRSMMPDNWIIKEQTPDYFIDYYVEMVNDQGELTGNICYVQLKGKSNIKSHHKEIKYQLSSKHLNYFKNDFKAPVFLIIIDTKINEGYWIFLQKYINDNFKGNIPQITKSIRIPITNNLSNIMDFRNSIIAAQKYMTDLHSSSIINAITNIGKRYPDISMKFERNKEQTKYSIQANNPFKIIFKDDKRESYKKMVEMSQLNGEPITLKISDIIIQGFDYINELINESRITTISVDPLINFKSNVTIFTRDSNNQLSTLLNTINGKTRISKEFTNFAGTLDGSPFSISIKLKTETKASEVNVELTINYDFKKWINKNISLVPIEEKLFNFFNDIKNNYEVELRLEIMGNHLLTMKNKLDSILPLAEIFIRTQKFIYVCKKMKYLIPFPDLSEILKIDNNDLEIMYNLLKLGEFVSSGINYTITGIYKAINDTPINRNMIIDEIELLANFKLEVSKKNLVLNGILIRLNKFEIDEIINLEVKGVPSVQIKLKANQDSKIIYLYEPNTLLSI
jgi:hypothetical protein